MGWLIALAVVVLLAMLPLGVSARYDEGGAVVKIIAGPVRMTLFPMKKKEKKPEAEKPKKQESAPKKAAPAPKPAEKGGSLTDFLPLVQLALDFLGDFRRKLRVNRLVVKLTMAGDDPCDLAVNYGRASAAVAGLLPQLDRLFVIRKQDISVNCDFTADKTLVIAGLDITITLGRLLCLAVGYGIRAVREYLNIMKLRKGGAVK